MTGKIGPCRTPGAIYETDVQPSKLVLHVLFPAPILNDLSQDENATLIKEAHDAILPIIEKLYSRAWSKHFAERMITDHEYPMPTRHQDL
jgi:hypothetical protein